MTLRYTVCAVQRQESQIKCFKETLNHSQTPVFSTYNHLLDDRNPAVYVDFVPIAANTGDTESLPDIIVVHRDGTVRRFSADLQKTRWVAASVLKSEEGALPPQIISAHWVSYADASTALLQKRDDVLRECAVSACSFLVLISRDGDHRESKLSADVFDVPITLRPGLSSANSDQRLRLLVSNQIPESRRWNLAPSLHIDFHAPSARLSISSRNELINYDLSPYAPHVSSKLSFDDGHNSLFSLTGTVAAGALRSAVRIYDTEYQSVKAHFELSTKFRRRGPQDSAWETVCFISYFAKVNVLVAVRGRELLAFNLPMVRVKKGSLFQSGSFLIDSLGRSTYAPSRVTTQAQAKFGPGFSKALFVPNQLEKAGWEARKKELDELVLQHQIEEFERLMADEFQEATAEEKKDRTRYSQIELPGSEQFVRYDKIHYLISKIFRASVHPPATGEGNKEADVVMPFCPPNLLQWLAQNNHLRTSEIERALSDELWQVQLSLGAVAKAIMEHDPSLNLLVDYLHGANLSGVDEAVTMIKLLIKNAVAMALGGSSSEQRPLKDSHELASEEPIMYGKEISAPASQSTVAVGSWSRECVMAMNRTLEILYGFSPLKITSAIRSRLNTENALALIQFLRQQLFRSGFTNSFSSSSVVVGGNVLSPEITIAVLSSCIDALGPLGFLSSAFHQQLWQGLVPDVKTEISLALAGIEEANYLRGVLQEMVRYGNAAASTQVLSKDSSPQQLGKPGTEDGMIPRMYGEPLEAQAHVLHGRSSLLPLGLDVENNVSKTKKRKGGGDVSERTGRELQYLKNRNIGRYNFERLRL